jgi:hypothetical protein
LINTDQMQLQQLFRLINRSEFLLATIPAATQL